MAFSADQHSIAESPPACTTDPRLYSGALDTPTSNAQLSVHVKANVPFIVYNILAFLLASVPRAIPV